MALSKIPPAGHAQYVGARNLVINGAMQVAQRGTVTGLTNGYGGPDRFLFGRSGAAAVTFSQDTSVPSGQGFSNSFKIDVTTADSSLAAGDYAFFQHKVEAQNLQHLLYGTSEAKRVTLQFWVKSAKTGVHIVELMAHDAAYYNNQSYTIASANTWQKVTMTFDGYQSGAINNDNGIGFAISWWLAAGSTYAGGTLSSNTWHNTQANRAVGQVNVMDSTSNNFYITGVQLEVGDSASDFEHRSFGDELARCQRYYAVIADGSEAAPSTIAMGSMYNSSNVYGALKLATEMRTGPTLDATTGTNYYLFYRNNTSDAFNSVTLSISQRAAIEFYNQTEISGTAGHSGFFRTGNVSAKIALTAEL